MFTKDDLSNARRSKDVCVLRDIAKVDIKWKDIYPIYENAKDKDILHASFLSLIIHNTQEYTDAYSKIIDSLLSVHPGKLVGVNSIIHFFSRSGSTLEDEYGLAMRNSFVSKTPHRMPEDPFSNDQNGPSIHSDAADGFFIQNEGKTLWKVYRDEGVKEYTVNPGDIIYIPKHVIHSVESLGPRHSASIVVKEPQSFLCKHCGSLNK